MYILIYKMKKRSKKYNKKTRHMQRGGCGTYWTDVTTVSSKVVPVSTNSSTTITPDTKELFVHAAKNAANAAEQYSGAARHSANNVKMYTTDTKIITNASRYANHAERQSKIASKAAYNAYTYAISSRNNNTSILIVKEYNKAAEIATKLAQLNAANASQLLLQFTSYYDASTKQHDTKRTTGQKIPPQTIKNTSSRALSSVPNASLDLEIRTLANVALESATAADKYDMDAKLSYAAATKSATAARVSTNSTLNAGFTDAIAKKAANNSNIAAENAKQQSLFTTENAKAARFSSNEATRAAKKFVLNTTTPKNNLYTSAKLHVTLAKYREQNAAIHAGKAKEYATLAETYEKKSRGTVSNSINLPLAFKSNTSVKRGGSRHKKLLLSRCVTTKKIK